MRKLLALLLCLELLFLPVLLYKFFKYTPETSQLPYSIVILALLVCIGFPPYKWKVGFRKWANRSLMYGMKLSFGAYFFNRLADFKEAYSGFPVCRKTRT